ncbi:alpha/beta hydrolase [Arenicella xantha]|uniref:Monoacylglycerol lipase n=1 Tax=Arenicella xantha TaxID=644221 RepID=A0A395JSW5_9GAMM|nr:alpha/beta hydrolase [Arenicella xantha]RBP53635.1 alpha-beta hydrolase superfamily lysophospholipase [Arenicella xantha]
MSQISDHTDHGLYYRHWTPEGKVKGVVMLIHGLGEHCQRYDALGEFLNQYGYALSAIDLPCHGHSEGKRGHIDSFDEFQSAALKLHARIRESYPDTPLFLLGHSMGGLIAARFLLDHQDKFSGALLSGAAIQSPQEPPKWQVAIIKGIAKLFPKAAMLQLDASAISRDPEVVDKYMADPLVSKDKLSARFLVEMTNTMDTVKANAAKITLPILIMHGTKDVMTAPEGSQLLFNSVSSPDKHINLYDGLYHEIFNEPEGQQIFAEVVTWLNAHG